MVGGSCVSTFGNSYSPFRFLGLECGLKFTHLHSSPPPRPRPSPPPPRRTLGVGVCQLPFGVLVATFARSTLPAVAVAEIQKCVQALRC